MLYVYIVLDMRYVILDVTVYGVEYSIDVRESSIILREDATNHELRFVLLYRSGVAGTSWNA